MAKYYTSLFLLCAFSAPGTAVMAQHAIAPCIRDHGQPAAAAHVAPPQGSFRSDPIWSDDFSDPSHWTFGTLNSTAHNWVIGTGGPSGDYAIDTIMSTTASNGFALFDSDVMCGPDNGYVAIASSVDLSEVPHVQLQFEQFYRRFQGQTWVDVSADNVSWTSIEVNSQLTTGAYTANPAITSVDISAVAGNQATVWFRFRYTGNCDYAWMVDDVALVEQPANEISLVSASTTTWDFDTAESFDSVYYSNFPVTELRPLAVNLTVFNAGYLPAENVLAHITTSDGYDESSNLGTIAPGDTVTWFGPLWTPTGSNGQHDIQFRVQADAADLDTTDNVIDRGVGVNGQMVNEDKFLARDNGALTASVGDGLNAFKVGNWIHVRNDHNAVGILVALSANSGTEFEINGQLLDSNRDPIAETEYQTVEASDLNGPGGGGFVLLPFSTPPALTAGSDYFVAVQHFGGMELWVGASGISEPQSSLLYRASVNTWYSISPTPMVRLVTDLHMDEAGAVDELSGVGHVGLLSPNPADTRTHASFMLDRATQVELSLVDLSGRPVRTLATGAMAAGRHEVEVDTRSLATGVYNCILRTAEGMASQRLVVMH